MEAWCKRAIKLRFLGMIAVGSIVTWIAIFVFAPLVRGQGSAASKTDTPAGAQIAPKDLFDAWMGYNWRSSLGPGKGPGGIQNYAAVDQKIPEPPLTEWAKQHLLYKSISHDPLDGKRVPGWDQPGRVCPSEDYPCFSEDQNGVPVNDINGEYAGRDCEPLSSPAIYELPFQGELEFLPTPDGTRILEFVEYHREWRTFWLNREHPKDLDLTYEGDSIAHWEGSDLVVDTTGYNDKTMISENVAHRKSDTFRLVERFHLMDKNKLEIQMTLYDPKAWGDKSWPGFKKYYYRGSNERFREYICSPRENRTFDNNVIDPRSKALQGQ